MNKIPFFSLVCPTRNRIFQVEKLLCSLKENTYDYANIEILFAYDDDDIISKAYLENSIKRFPFSIRYYEREQSDFLNRDYYNFLESKSNGKFVFLVGDDLIFIKKDWDNYLISEIENYLKNKKSKILYIKVGDNTLKNDDSPNFANFPIISKEAIKVLGFFMIPEIPSWSADYLIFLIYSHQNIQRVLNIEDNIILHVSPHSNLSSEDESSKKQRRVHSLYKVPEFVEFYKQNELPLLIGKLTEYLKSKEK